ncbi:uncharacterized protein MONBRDRAFT_34033 [Monosiga brevicollis MX1]|uniref:3-oxoacyl-[acyl-carrier-protein] synthase n=1 Tax=Monosiga brevicollis TaxID=81824 RepID=A9V9H2_MONBE|nr:uncharacterized protein MONBRDRAFT_34033 [Monosiga brevicollis MX1]EDQ85863.1 predicted protein [Monosiga brevicollis MX1]|eukprot:XP_001749342.1 hypothetical protein [Monosiga brevicollis MX1]
MARRVVVTGLGLITPLGCGPHPRLYEHLLHKASGVRQLRDREAYEQAKVPVHIAAEVPALDQDSELGFDPAHYSYPLHRRALPPNIQFALAAAEQALCDAQLTTRDQPDLQAHAGLDPTRAGVAVGTGISGVHDLLSNQTLLQERGHRRVSPYLIPNALVNMSAGLVSIHHNLQGPNLSASTACATGAHSIGDAFRMIKYDDADIMVCGGAEACIHPLIMSGFARAKALASTFNDTPDRASRPFDQARAGFVMGEGAAVLILEEEAHARARNAPIYAQVLGYGASGDAHHITAPHPSGRGAIGCMQAALREARLEGSDVQYVNAHATSTPIGDEIEGRAIAQVCGPSVAVSSTKGATGHLLGAAGALEAAFAILALKHQTAPPTLNLESPAEGLDLNLLTQATQLSLDVALSNSFGFGGTNVSLAFGKA